MVEPAWLDMESRRRFEKEFASATVVQQKEILDLIAYPKRAATEHAAQVAFFNRFRDLVAGGFFTSKMGIDDLGYQRESLRPTLGWMSAGKFWAKLGL